MKYNVRPFLFLSLIAMLLLVACQGQGGLPSVNPGDGAANLVAHVEEVKQPASVEEYKVPDGFQTQNKRFLEVIEGVTGYTITQETDIGVIVLPPERVFSCGEDENIECVPEWYANQEALLSFNILYPQVRRITERATFLMGPKCKIFQIAQEKGYTIPNATATDPFVQIVGKSLDDTNMSVSVRGYRWDETHYMFSFIALKAEYGATLNEGADFENLAAELGCE